MNDDSKSHRSILSAWRAILNPVDIHCGQSAHDNNPIYVHCGQSVWDVIIDIIIHTFKQPSI